MLRQFLAPSLTLLTVLACTATASAFDPAKLVGDWSYVSGMRDGEEVPPERLAGDVKITKETFTIPGGPDVVFVMAYELDTEKDPVTIDFEIQEGPVPEGTALGVIKLADDTITLCYDPTGQERPGDFESTEDNGAFLFVLKRKS